MRIRLNPGRKPPTFSRKALVTVSPITT